MSRPGPCSRKFWNFLSIAVFCEVKATKHCNAQKIPKFPTPKLTKHCNAQKIPKIPKFWHLCPGQDQIPQKFWNFWNFLSITVFREFWGWKFWNFLSITVFCEVKPRNTVMLKKNQCFTASKLTKLEHSSVSWLKPHKTL